jgi:predicted CDP-diglyceride synthetase/phosphatidate cytidylyltransferase
MAIGSLRVLFLLFTAAILGARAAGYFSPGSSWAALDRRIGGYWWLLVVIGAVSVIGLRRVLDEIDTP